MIALIALSTALSWQSHIRGVIKANPDYVGKIVEVCVDQECVTVDRSKDILPRIAAKDDGPAVVEAPPATAKDGLSTILTTVLDKVGGAHGEVKVDFKESTKGADGSEHTVEVHVEVSGGTGIK